MVTVTDDTLVEGMENYILAVSVSSGPAIIGEMDTIAVNIEDNDCKIVCVLTNCFEVIGRISQLDTSFML